MAYAIMRSKKLSTMGGAAASLQHCYRDRETPNADASKTHQNEHGEAKSTDEAMGRMRALLPAKRRKDAVLAIEYVLTASPEWWKQASEFDQAKFFEQSRAWLAEKYGADRVIVSTVHRDEATPHLSAFVVPLTADGRLSAKEFIGGRDKMSKDQTTFAATVKNLGLERGIEGSKAIHERVKTFYGALEQAPVQNLVISPKSVTPKVISKGMFSRQEETFEAVAARLTKQVISALSGTFDRASTAVLTHRRMVGLQLTADAQAERLTVFRGLTKDQVRQVILFAMKLYRENLQKQDEKLLVKAQKARSEERQKERGR